MLLTLAVNVAVMAAALYAVLAYMAWDVAADAAAGVGRAGARSGAAEGASSLIFVELLIVTAIALFFSTFSTPILSAALTFGFFVAGHFSADLRNFDQVVDSPAAAGDCAALYWVLPNLGTFDVGAGRPRAAGHGRLRRADVRVSACSTSRPWSAWRRWCSRDGISSKWIGLRLCRRSAEPSVIAALMGTAALLQHVREAKYPAPPPTKESLYLTPEQPRVACPSVIQRWPRIFTGFAPFSTTATPSSV